MEIDVPAIPPFTTGGGLEVPRWRSYVPLPEAASHVNVGASGTSAAAGAGEASPVSGGAAQAAGVVNERTSERAEEGDGQ